MEKETIVSKQSRGTEKEIEVIFLKHFPRSSLDKAFFA